MPILADPAQKRQPAALVADRRGAAGLPDQAERAAQKSPAAFRTIAEVAGELELPAHVLRFWESKFPQVKPLKRRGGRRYYRPEDVALLRRIRTLLYTDGYTIRGVQRLLKETGGKGAVREAADAGSDDEAAELIAAGPAIGTAAGDDGERPGEDGDRLGDDGLIELLDELEAIRALLRRHGF